VLVCAFCSASDARWVLIVEGDERLDLIAVVRLAEERRVGADDGEILSGECADVGCYGRELTIGDGHLPVH
jgi:hypothetical protein